MTRPGGLPVLAGSRWRAWALAAVAVFAGTAEGQRFDSILWVNNGLESDEQMYSAIPGLGFTAVTISADQDPSIPERHGLRFYRDQVAGKGVFELREGPWTVQRARYEEGRNPRDLVRPPCLTMPGVVDASLETLRARLELALPHRPFAASLGDEVSITRHNNPLDFCFSSTCLDAFRRFLAGRHGGVMELNRAWGSGFVRLDDVVPYTADRIRARELSSELPGNLMPWSEHLEFVDQRLADVTSALAREVAAASPGLPCGLTGMQPPTAYGGHDYRRLMPSMGFYEAYDIGGARDLAMSLARPGAAQIATLTPPAADAPAGMVRGRIFDMVAHGMAGVVVWSAREVFGPDAEPTVYGRRVADAFRSLRRAADVTAGAVVRRSPVWILESQAAVRAHWMLDSAEDGRTWIRRLSSYEHRNSTSLAARHSWVRLFEDLGMQARLVPVEQLGDRLRGGAPRLLVLPALLSLSDDAAESVRRFVEGGGVAVADHGLGVYDELLRRRPAGALDGLFGVRGRSFEMADLWVRQGRADDRGRMASGVGVAEPGLEGVISEPFGAHQVHIEHRPGKGRTVYLNLAVCEYGKVRLAPDQWRAAADIRRRVRKIAHDAGVRPPVVVRGTGLPTCIERLELRTPGGRRVLAVRLNALESPELMRQLADRGEAEITVTFPAEVRLRELVSGEDLGSATEFTMTLDPWTGILLEVLP